MAEKQPSPKESSVELALGRTVGLPNFSSIRVDIGVRIPCGGTPEAREAAYQEALDFCVPRFKAETDKVVAFALEQERRRNE